MLHLVRVLVALALTLPPGDPVARVDPPAAVSAQVTDRAGVLGGRRAEVEAAVAKLRAHRGVRLYVVYVESFSGSSATDWAAGTARLSGLGRLDLLLAVATADGRYAVFADQAFPLSGEQLDSVAATTIEPELRRSDWAGAPIVAAREYDAVLASPSVVSASAPFRSVPPGGRPGKGPLTSLKEKIWAAHSN
ncbi:TPM domain-containing protein [Streptosporangium sp. NBC_01639]|uniref:TPM domain-containing protein n=1 Tax=Streptosporangium sp. NBC_01639 TaxID=2975948 RepID=UPI00386E0E7B|nr:TPM domain-containing protein [Streptosporangium sp. NBC_01639]